MVNYSLTLTNYIDIINLKNWKKIFRTHCEKPENPAVLEQCKNKKISNQASFDNVNLKVRSYERGILDIEAIMVLKIVIVLIKITKKFSCLCVEYQLYHFLRFYVIISIVQNIANGFIIIWV